MNEVLLARQPILDGDLTAVGYELLYREAGSDAADVRDDELATARVSLRAMSEIELERLVDRPARRVTRAAPCRHNTAPDGRPEPIDRRHPR
jgi:c-di-GMP-related signal transduction protein